MNNYKKKICHLTSVHPRYDIRIFEKECLSLSKFYDISLIVADGKGDEVENGIRIFDVGNSCSRYKRITDTTKKVFKKAIELDCDLYHIHDPELLYYGLLLRNNGKKVIYDAHEDVPKQVMGKMYYNIIIRLLLSFTIKIFEDYIAKRAHAIVVANPLTYVRFKKLNANSVNICNYALLREFDDFKFTESKFKKNSICYIGGISKVRGIFELFSAIEMSKIAITLELAGEVEGDELKKQLMSHSVWKKVNYHGFVNRKGILEILEKSKIGIVILHPTPNHLNALPIKLFEYMAAGIPVVVSNFRHWEAIVKEEKCGICVDPFDIDEIVKAINFLIENPDISDKMGKNGRKAVFEKYNWNIEEEKLIKLYEGVFK